jgi:hypothetical protein
MRRIRKARLCSIALLGAMLLLVGTGCRRTGKLGEVTPHDNIVSMVAEFKLLSAADPYGDAIGTDLTGQSIARVTLLRASNHESLYPGRFVPEILTLKGRALELLGEYQSAKRNYDEAAEYDTELREDLRRRVRLLDRFLTTQALAVERSDIAVAARQLQEQAAEFRRLAESVEEQPYRGLALREAEQAEVQRAEMLTAARVFLPDGDAEAQRALEELVANHRGSARAYSHALRLARFHRALAEEEARLRPADRPAFDKDRFKRHYDQAADLLYRVSQADGNPERLAAAHELDALLDWGDSVRALTR